MNNYKLLAIITALSLVLTMESAVVYSFITPPDVIKVGIRPFNNKVATTLRVQVFDSDGNLRGTRYKDNDLILTNFRNFLVAMFTSQTTGTITASMTDIANAAKTINVRVTANVNTNTWCDTQSDTENKGGQMAIGEGSTAPVVANYGMETIYGAYVRVTDGFPQYDPVTHNVTITSTFDIAASKTITEAGLFVSWVDSTGNVFTFAMTRDTFTGIAVVDGDTVVVTLVFHLSDDFTNHFGWFLMYLFRYVLDGGIVQGLGAWATYPYLPSWFDMTGSSVNQRNYYFSGTASISCYGTVADGQPIGGSCMIMVGSSNQMSGNMQVNLYSPVGTRTSVSPAPAISGNNIIIIADCVMTGASTLREAGFFLVFYSSSTIYYSILFWRTTFDPVTIAAGHAIQIQFTLYL